MKILKQKHNLTVPRKMQLLPRENITESLRIDHHQKVFEL